MEVNDINLKNLKIIGTSHIAKQSVGDIEYFLDNNSVDIVCIELDKQRLHALLNNIETNFSIKNISMIRHIGVIGFLFASLASFVQKSLGKKVKSKPGADMLSAFNVASRKGIKVMLIDQNVNVTLKKLSKNVKFLEVMKMIFDMIKGLLGFKTELMDVDIKDLNLSKVPSERLIEQILNKTKYRYPGLYNALVHERNVFMSRKIMKLMSTMPNAKILAVVGAGHKEGMLELLEKRTKQKYDDDVSFPTPNMAVVYSSSYVHDE